MNILIIEDEELAVSKLENTLAKVAPEAVITGVTDSISGTLAWLETNPHPDVILSDIELTDGQSFEIFNRIAVNSLIIFVTSYDEFAMKAFKVNSIDYLLKPVQQEDLAAALAKYRRLRQQPEGAGSSLNMRQLLAALNAGKPAAYRKRFLVKNAARLISVGIEEIAYFFFDGKLCFFRTHANQKFVVDYTLDELEGLLDPEEFFRISRGFIISVKAIGRIDDYFNHRLILRLKPENEKEAVVSREKVTDFKRWLGK